MKIYKQTLDKYIAATKNIENIGALCKAMGVSRSYFSNYYQRQATDVADFPMMAVISICQILEITKEQLAEVPAGVAQATAPAPAPAPVDISAVTAKAEQIAFNVVKIKDNVNFNHDELLKAVVKLTEAVEKLQKGIHTDMVTIQGLVKPAPLSTAYGKVLTK